MKRRYRSLSSAFKSRKDLSTSTASLIESLRRRFRQCINMRKRSTHSCNWASVPLWRPKFTVAPSAQTIRNSCFFFWMDVLKQASIYNIKISVGCRTTEITLKYIKRQVSVTHDRLMLMFCERVLSINHHVAFILFPFELERFISEYKSKRTFRWWMSEKSSTEFMGAIRLLP